MILAIDTSSTVPNVALGVDGQVVAQVSTTEGNSTEQLPFIVSKLLDLAKLKFESLSAVIVAAGPGSFTGIRSGISFAQGVASAREIPLIGADVITSRVVLTLKDNPQKEGFCAALRANKGEFFIRQYSLNCESKIESIAEIETISEDSLAELEISAGLLLIDQDQLASNSASGILLSYFREEPAVIALFQHSTATKPIEPIYIKPASALTVAERQRVKN